MSCEISIIIPAFNLELVIADTVRSCLNQTYSNIEIIIINDGSTDKTEEAVKPLLSDLRVKYYYQKNSGVSAARNRGVELSNGNYLLFLDGDDLLAEDTIEKNIQLIKEWNNPIDWLAFPLIRETADGRELNTSRKNLLKSFRYKQIKEVSAREAFQMYEAGNIPPIVCSMLFRKSFFDKKFIAGRYEDSYMFFELLTKNPHIVFSPFGRYRYINRENSFINEKFTPQKWIDYIRARIKFVQTGITLFPEKRLLYERLYTKMYYNLVYLKYRNKRDVDYGKPLEFLLQEVPMINTNIILLIKCYVKCFIISFINLFGR